MTPLFRIVVVNKWRVRVEQVYDDFLQTWPYPTQGQLLAGPFSTIDEATFWLRNHFSQTDARRYEVVHNV